MADFSGNFSSASFAGFNQILVAMKGEGQFADGERDIEPLDVSKNFTYQFMDYIIKQFVATMPAGTVRDQVRDQFYNSLQRQKTQHQDLAADSDYDSTMSTVGVAFHTMTALGRKKGNDKVGVARAMSSLPGGSDAMVQYLFMLDQDDNFLGGRYTLSVAGKSFGEVSVDNVALTDATDTGANGLYVVHYIKGGVDYIGAQYWQVQEYPVNDPAITAPVQKGNNVNYQNIVIGLGRGTTILGVHGDADYAYRYLSPGHAYVPFSGSVTFGSAIQDINDPANLRAKLYLTTASGHVIQAISPNWTQHLSVNGSTLSWDWPYASLAYFGTISWGVDKAVYLHFEVGVKTANSQGKFVYAQVHSMDASIVPAELQITQVGWGKEDQVNDGISYIYPIEHAWHCVAAGTKVKMADGSEKLIDDIIGGEEIVIDAQGNTMEVRSTVEQPVMFGETVYKLVTANGDSLLITGDHWVPVPGGYKPVEELVAGEEVETMTGAAAISSIEQVNYNGILFTLSLGNHERRPDIGFKGTTFAANNILVGDNQLCRVQTIRRLKDHDMAAAKLPGEFKAIADGLKGLA